MNLLKVIVLSLISTVMFGCASLESVGTKMINNKESGIIYGFAGVDESSSVNAKKLCEATKNVDSRCLNPQDYVVVYVFAKFGYSDGAVGINALVPKNFPNLDSLNHTMVSGNKKAPYVKAKITPGQLGEVLEVVSTNGDGKCYWYGMPRIGGTVCPAYNYDYHKDFTGVVFR